MANNEMRYCEFCGRETLFFLSDDWSCGECGCYFDSGEDSWGNRCPHCGEDLEEKYNTVCPYCGETLDGEYETAHEKEYHTLVSIILDDYNYTTIQAKSNFLERISFEEYSKEEIIELCECAVQNKYGKFFLAMGECYKDVVSTYFKSLSVKEKMAMVFFSLDCLEAIYKYDSIDSTEFYYFVARFAGGYPDLIGNGSIYQTILKKSPGFRECEYLGRVFIHAVQNNDKATAEFALKNLWDVPKDKYQKLIDKALARSVCSGSVEMIDYMLMQKGANAERVKKEMCLRASMLGKLDVIKHLIDIGIAIQPYIYMMLGQAAKFGNSDLIFYLLNDIPEVPIDNMESLLQLAISFRQPDTALRLVLNGVNKDKIKPEFFDFEPSYQPYMGEEMLDDFMDSFSARRRVSYRKSMEKNSVNDFLAKFSDSRGSSYFYDFYEGNPAEDFLCDLLTGDEYDINVALSAAFFKRQENTYSFLLNKKPKNYKEAFPTFDVMTERYYANWSYSGLYMLNNCPLCYSSDLSFGVNSEFTYWKCGDCGVMIKIADDI